MPTPVRDHLPVLATVGVDAAALVRVTVKLAPSAPSDDGTASGWSFSAIIVMGSAPDPLIETCEPFCTVKPLENDTVPKLSSDTNPR